MNKQIIKINFKQALSILCAVTLVVLLLFANTKPPLIAQVKIAETNSTENFESIILEASNGLKGEAKARLSTWKEDFDHATNEQKLGYLDSLSKTWDELKRPDIAAYYAEQKAVIADRRSDLWNKAGERYYNAVRFAAKDKQSFLYQNAIRCFEKTLNLEPDNLDAKTSLGACYVEGTADPMKGIGLLREVIAKDSTHLNAQLNLAFFSVKSGQFEKAIERFNKVLTINPGYVEAYLFLADVYEKTGEKQKAVTTLEKYMGLVDDVTIKNEVENYINKLKRS